MKRVVSLILAVMMCLSLCACGNADQSPANSKKSEEVYEAALRLLEESTTLEEGASEKIKEAYELLVSLGEYEGAKECLAKINQKELCVAKETTSYDAFGQPSSYTISYQYDMFGRLAIEDNQRYGPLYIEYDMHNRVVSKTRKMGDQIASIQTCTYNDDNQCISQITRHNNGETFETIYQYDANGNLLNESMTDAFEGYVITYKYNDEGNLIEKNKNGKGGDDDVYRYDSLYDENGKLQRRVVELSSRFRDSYVHTENYTYVNDNLISIETYNETQDLVAKETYTYETLYFYNP